METKILVSYHEETILIVEYRMLGSLLYYDLTCDFGRCEGRSCGTERYVPGWEVVQGEKQ